MKNNDGRQILSDAKIYYEVTGQYGIGMKIDNLVNKTK